MFDIPLPPTSALDRDNIKPSRERKVIECVIYCNTVVKIFNNCFIK
jgi:hypothetical protein